MSSLQLCLQCGDAVIASGSADSTIRLWNYAGMSTLYCRWCFRQISESVYVHDHFPIGFCLHVLEGHIGNVRCLCLVGNRLISGGDRKRIIVWNAEVSHICILYGKDTHSSIVIMLQA